MADGSPLQIIRLDQDENKVEIDEANLSIIEKNCRQYGSSMEVVVLSVMGAFRTGKSFALDVMLRYLRAEAAGKNVKPVDGPPRGNGEAYPVPEWMTGCLEGASEASSDGFRFKGGMDKCTEGIWIWSKPFKRNIDNKEYLLLLMDTQGAWDSEMTKEQSATIFGLTALLSSKLVYNISMQIQEDKVENLGFFMNFAQGALRSAAETNRESGNEIAEEEIERPFQALDFLVRDWRNFRDDWPLEECRKQMTDHLDRHVLKPKLANEKSTTTALKRMFHNIDVWCLPHPGFAIEKETWSGDMKDIQDDFVRFMDLYMDKTFSSTLETKKILGATLSCFSFGEVVRSFVAAFSDVQCHATTFTEAVQTATVLAAQDSLQQFYRKEMEKELDASSNGIPRDAFTKRHEELLKELQAQFKKAVIFGTTSNREDAWVKIHDGVERLRKRFEEDNERKLEKALSGCSRIALLAIAFFVLDRISDFVCDWWSTTCAEASKLMLLGYVAICGYIAYKAYFVFRDQGQIAVMMAAGELWKDMMRELQGFFELAQHPQTKQAILQALRGDSTLLSQVLQKKAPVPSNNKKDS
mmetsp:Transcript_66955/g.160358  ORF Transcript_66955/g.160358 Transcript_66955/m.160358 type:complete len:582 (+) Transcript_66955:117-1862(+)